MATYIMKKYLLILLSLLLVVGCKEAPKTAANLAKITVAYPEKRNITYRFEYPGYLQSEQTVDLIARVQGYLQEVKFQPGEVVKEGQVLFVIEPKPYEDQVKTAEANLETAKASLKLAITSNERTKEAGKTNAVSELDVIKAQTTLDQAKASVASAEAQLSTAKTNLSYCYVKAPFTGRVTRNLVDKGNMVGGQATLASMYKDTKLFVYFNVEDSKYLIGFTKENEFKLDNVEIRFDEIPNKVYKGKLDYMSPTVDLTTGTINVRAVVDNKGGELRNGLYTKIRVPYKEVQDALLIPEGAIGTDQSGRYIYTVNDSSVVEYRSVKVGELQEDSMREIVEGLKANERFVTKGIIRVRDGQKIEAVEEK